MPYCTKCGNMYSDSQKYCTKCGSELQLQNKNSSQSAPAENEDIKEQTTQQCENLNTDSASSQAKEEMSKESAAPNTGAADNNCASKAEPRRDNAQKTAENSSSGTNTSASRAASYQSSTEHTFSADYTQSSSQSRNIYTDTSNNIPPKGSEYAPIGIGTYIGSLILFAIPVVGFIVCLIWACGAVKNKNLLNYSRAVLILMLISIVLWIVFSVVAVTVGGSMASFYYRLLHRLMI